MAKRNGALFRRLFRDKQDLWDLYNALNGSTYKDPGELEVLTMEDVMSAEIEENIGNDTHREEAVHTALGRI